MNTRGMARRNRTWYSGRIYSEDSFPLPDREYCAWYREAYLTFVRDFSSNKAFALLEWPEGGHAGKSPDSGLNDFDPNPHFQIRSLTISLSEVDPRFEGITGSDRLSVQNPTNEALYAMGKDCYCLTLNMSDEGFQRLFNIIELDREAGVTSDTSLSSATWLQGVFDRYEYFSRAFKHKVDPASNSEPFSLGKLSQGWVPFEETVPNPHLRSGVLHGLRRLIQAHPVAWSGFKWLALGAIVTAVFLLAGGMSLLFSAGAPLPFLTIPATVGVVSLVCAGLWKGIVRPCFVGLRSFFQPQQRRPSASSVIRTPLSWKTREVYRTRKPGQVFDLLPYSLPEGIISMLQGEPVRNYGTVLTSYYPPEVWSLHSRDVDKIVFSDMPWLVALLQNSCITTISLDNDSLMGWHPPVLQSFLTQLTYSPITTMIIENVWIRRNDPDVNRCDILAALTEGLKTSSITDLKFINVKITDWSERAKHVLLSGLRLTNIKKLTFENCDIGTLEDEQIVDFAKEIASSGIRHCTIVDWPDYMPIRVRTLDGEIVRASEYCSGEPKYCRLVRLDPPTEVMFQRHRQMLTENIRVQPRLNFLMGSLKPSEVPIPANSLYARFFNAPLGGGAAIEATKNIFSFADMKLTISRPN